MIDPRMQEFLEAQRRGSLVIGFTSSALGVFLLIKTFSIGWPSFVLAALASFICMRVASAIHFMYLQHRIYKNNAADFMMDTEQAIDHFQEMLDESLGPPPPSNQPVVDGKLNLPALSPFIVVGAPEKHIGSFMDAKIFEWLDFMGRDGVTRRFKYHSVAQTAAQRAGILPEGCIIINPGIIYQIDDTFGIIFNQLDETVE